VWEKGKGDMELFKLVVTADGELRFEPFNITIWLEAQVEAYEKEHDRRIVRDNEFFGWWLLQSEK